MAEITHIDINYELRMFSVMAKFDSGKPEHHFLLHFGADYARPEDHVGQEVQNLVMQLESAVTRIVTDRVRKWVDESERPEEG